MEPFKNTCDTTVDSVLTAIRQKNFKTLKLLARKGYKFDVALNDHDQTAVHIAAEMEYFPALELIFSNWKNGKNSVDSKGMTCFHAACMVGNEIAVCNLIKSNLDVNAHTKNSGFTPLHLSVKYCHLNTAKLLMNFVEVNRVDSLGRTPLHLACSIPETMVQVVLPNLVVSQKQCDRVYLTKASKFQSQMLQILMLLLQHKRIDVNAKDAAGDIPAAYVFKDYTFCYLDSMLEQSTLDSRIACRKFAQIRRITMRKTRYQKKTKLRMLLEHPKFNVHDYPKVLHYILKDVKEMRELKELWSPVFEDVDHVDMIKQILRRRGKVDALNENGETVLQVAIKAISADIVDLLLTYKPKIDKVKFSFDFFFYPDILPDLEATENLLRIVDSLSEVGFDFDIQVKLVIMKFLIRNNESCNYVDPAFELASYKLTNLLELGCPENVENSLEKISGQRNVRYSGGLVSNQVNRYLIKIKYNGFQLSKEFEDCLRANVTDAWNNIEQRELDNYKNEAEKFRQWKGVNDESFIDILQTQNYDLIYSTFKNSNIAQKLKSDDFKSQFPLSAGFVKGYFAKSLVRRFVVNTAMDCIREVICRPLPDPCCKKIADYLSNEDLWRVCLSALSDKYMNNVESLISNINFSD